MSREASRAVRVARAAARRATLGDLIRRTGRAMCWGAVVSALLVAADRLGIALAPWALLVFVPVGAGVLGALVFTLLRPRTVQFGAGAVDRALGLKDRVSTGVALARGRPSDEPFAAWAIADADEAASRASVSKAVPLRAEWTWGAWPTLVAACIAAALFVPALNWDRADARPTPARELAARREAVQQIQQAAETAREVISEQPGTVATPQELAAIEDLQRQLEAGEADPRQAVTKAAGELGTLAERTKRDAARSVQAHDALREQLAAAAEAEGQTPRDGAAGPLEEALSRGDLDAAGEAAGELAREAQSLSPQEQLELAQDLERLADAVRPAAREPAPDPVREELREELERQGLTPEQIEQVEQQADPQKAAEELEKQGLPPEAARKQAEKVAEQAERREAEKSARERMQELERNLRESAERLRNPETPPEQPEGNQEPSREQAPPGQPPTTPEQRDATQPPDPSRPQQQEPSQQQPSREGQPGSPQPVQPSPQQSQPPVEPTEPRQTPQGQPTPRNQPGQQPQPTPGAQPDQKQPAERPEPQGAPQLGEQPGQRQPMQQPDPQGVPQSGEQQPPQTPGAQPQPQPGEQPGGQPQPRGLEGLRQTLERMAEGRHDAQRQARQAERFRDAAEELMKGASEEDRREMAERWGGAGKGVRGEVQRKDPTRWAAGDEPVDARRAPAQDDRPQERVIAEWYSQRPVDRTGAAPATAGAMQEDIRQAARGAERAIEQQGVPSRYSDLVRRVFRRYEERAAPPPAGP